MMIGAARREHDRIEPARTEGESTRSPEMSRRKLAWIVGWPPLFVAAFVASTVVHDPADEVEGSLSLGNGVSTTEWALFLVGFSGLVIWILGCLVLAVQGAIRAHSAAKAHAPTKGVVRKPPNRWPE